MRCGNRGRAVSPRRENQDGTMLPPCAVGRVLPDLGSAREGGVLLRPPPPFASARKALPRLARQLLPECLPRNRQAALPQSRGEFSLAHLGRLCLQCIDSSFDRFVSSNWRVRCVYVAQLPNPRLSTNRGHCSSVECKFRERLHPLSRRGQDGPEAQAPARLG